MQRIKRRRQQIKSLVFNLYIFLEIIQFSKSKLKASFFLCFAMLQPYCHLNCIKINLFSKLYTQIVHNDNMEKCFESFCKFMKYRRWQNHIYVNIHSFLWFQDFELWHHIIENNYKPISTFYMVLLANHFCVSGLFHYSTQLNTFSWVNRKENIWIK